MPCPTCGRAINFQAGQYEVSIVFNFIFAFDFSAHGQLQIQPIIPMDMSSLQTVKPLQDSDDIIPSATHSSFSSSKILFNFIPLCSRSESDTEMWGCSEQLDRARIEREEVNSTEDASNDGTAAFQVTTPHLHMIDWIIEHNPQRLYEICMRLQLAHGDNFDLSAGESLCLRFVREVYGGNSCKVLGFAADILDIADCFSEHTDKEMLSIIEKKRIMTPHTIRRKRRAALRAGDEEDGDALHAASAVFRSMMDAAAGMSEGIPSTANDATAVVDVCVSKEILSRPGPATEDTRIQSSGDDCEDYMGLGW